MVDCAFSVVCFGGNNHRCANNSFYLFAQEMKRDISRLQKTVSSPKEERTGRLQMSIDGICTEFTIKDIPYYGFKGERYEKSVSKRKAPTLGKTANIKKSNIDRAIALCEEDILEDEVKKDVQRIIDLYQLPIDRTNTGAIKIQKRFIRFNKKGTGDFTGWCPFTGRHVEIECKRPVGGDLSDVQKNRLDRINAAGGVGIVVTSAADCLAQLKEAGVIRCQK
jgi:hypothetical protein